MMLLQMEEDIRKIYCDRAIELVSAIKEGMLRFDSQTAAFEQCIVEGRQQ